MLLSNQALTDTRAVTKKHLWAFSMLFIRCVNAAVNNVCTFSKGGAALAATVLHPANSNSADVIAV